MDNSRDDTAADVADDIVAAAGDTGGGGGNDAMKSLLMKLPKEAVAHLASYLPRSDFNNLALACKQIKRVLYEYRPEIAHWPARCPFVLLYREVEARGIFSPNMSRVAATIVSRQGEHVLQVWDLSVGLTAEVEYGDGASR